MLEDHVPTIVAGVITLGSLLALKKLSGGRDLLFNYYTPYGYPFRFLRGKSIEEAEIKASEYGGEIKLIEECQSGCFLYRSKDLNMDINTDALKASENLIWKI